MKEEGKRERGGGGRGGEGEGEEEDVEKHVRLSWKHRKNQNIYSGFKRLNGSLPLSLNLEKMDKINLNNRF